MKRETIVVLDFGSQYTQLIARRVREHKVYCEIHPYNIPLNQLASIQPKGIILSGGPASVYATDAPLLDPKILTLGVPILGICYGMQLIAHLSAGGKVHPAVEREFGSAELIVDLPIPLFADLSKTIDVWMSHGDRIDVLPDGFHPVAHTHNSPIAAIADLDRDIYGLQFHPEVIHTQDDNRLLANFVYEVCECSDEWTMQSFIAEATEKIRTETGGARVLCAVSGGVDSTVLAMLLKRAVGDALVCVFVNNGLLRKNEADQVLSTFRELGIDVYYVDATDQFLEYLSGVESPEQKRKIIGNQFIEVFKEGLEQIGQIDFLAQGTLYPDVIESVSVKGPSATIKTHHNVGGLPENLPFKLIEPLRELFKDEDGIPFPGPGLAVRILGPITQERLDMLREADEIFIAELRKAGLYDEIWQALTVFLPVKSVGVMGDERTYENVVALRAVTSTDGMTADWAKIPHNVLGVISNRIINEVRGINRVVYDISSKPPSTIEWE
ncbi:GMP synthase [glutamine-hydrolyzing] [Geodia barretti]|uniref:GMP synthase [glutamine-hydrolyzing] n=1 Tax=Geodia barretti TaxID=519541 RepID=A0AA35S3T6_GEOBA|nr:GMP synthase [glutamine-hydrolyzing] [Geodia barretti]